jgi:hypothetical protein
MIPAEHDRERMGPIDRRGARRGVWSERFVVGLLIACLAGTLNLVVVLHRKTATRPDRKPATPVSSPFAQVPPPSHVAKPAPAPKPELPPPSPPPEDPTKKALAELDAATARELEAGKKADRRAEAMEAGRRAAVAESERWRRRESLIRSQVASLTEKARRIERRIEDIALERDVLARERDALKAAVTKANTASSFAVLPFKGANGTWQRPIVLECEDGSVTLQPRGITFSMMDLNPRVHPRVSLVVQTIARELTVMEAAGSPDGAPVVPYLVFIVRPDGIRPYYEARARLEPLGISFGYELVPQDLKINFPDLADLKTWDGTTPLNVPSHLKDRGAGSTSDGPAPSQDLAMNRGPGPAGAGKPTAGDAWASGSAVNQGDRPNDYIWPTRPGGGRGDGSEIEGALDVARNAQNRGFPPALPEGEGNGGVGDSSAGAGGIGGAEPGRGGPSSGVRGSPGGIARNHPGPGAGGGKFRSRGAPGVDAYGSEFGFGRLPGSARGDAGRPAAVGETGNSTPGDIAGLLERPPGNAADGDLDGLIQEWTKRGAAMKPRAGIGAGEAGSDERPGRGGGNAGGTKDGPESEGHGRSPRTFGNMPPELARIGDERASGTGAGTNTDPSTAAAPPGGGGSGGKESRNPAGLPSGLSSNLLQAPPPDGPGNGASGSSSATSGPTSATGSGLGSREKSRSSSTASSSGVGFGLSPSLSPSTSSSSAPKSSDASWDDLPPLPQPDRNEPLRIDAAFEVVIDCERDGIEILPGGNRITLKTIREEPVGDGAQGQRLLTRHLRFLERKRAIVDPMIRPVPRVKFIVEPGGDETYLAVRRQLLFSGLDWPMTVQLIEGQGSRFFSRELW